jgi:hypothetical protein
MEMDPELMDSQDVNADGVTDVEIYDRNADGTADTVIGQEPDTGNYLVQYHEDDGSRTSLVYDPFGVIFGAEFVNPSGEVVQLAGDGLDTFLQDYSERTGREIPLTFPAQDENLVAQVPIDEETLFSAEEVTQSEAYQDWAQSVIQVPPEMPVEVPETPVPSTEAPVEPSVPVEAPSTLIGDVSDASFWFQQNTQYTCGPASATQIVEDFTGVDYPNEDALAAYANQMGWLSDTGMQPQHLADLLTAHGVPSSVVPNQNWENLAGYLQEGRSVVMFVDGFDYWPGGDGQDQPENTGTDVVNHFARIVAIDTERGVAILADPGTPNGYQLEVPLGTLEEAWNDVTSYDAYGNPTSDRMLVVSNYGDPTPVSAAAGVGSEGQTEQDPMADIRDLTERTATAEVQEPNWRLFSNPHGWVIVPITLAATRILAAVRK